MELTLTDRERAALERGRNSRNPGREPYSRNEYIVLLLLNDEHSLYVQDKAAPACRKCRAQPPQYCERVFKGEASCWLSYDCLSLNLTVVTGHSESNHEVDHKQKQQNLNRGNQSKTELAGVG